ncbi:MAG: Ig-like domain-containing protein [Bacteroidota bacterium]
MRTINVFHLLLEGSYFLLFLGLSGICLAQGPAVTNSFPMDGSSELIRNAFVSVQLDLPNEGLDYKTVNDESVKLYPQHRPGSPVEAFVSASNELKNITLEPKEILEPATTYTFEITPAVKDREGTAIEPFRLQFSTGVGAQEKLITSASTRSAAQNQIRREEYARERLLADAFKTETYVPEANIAAAKALAQKAEASPVPDPEPVQSNIQETVPEPSPQLAEAEVTSPAEVTPAKPEPSTEPELLAAGEAVEQQEKAEAEAMANHEEETPVKNEAAPAAPPAPRVVMNGFVARINEGEAEFRWRTSFEVRNEYFVLEHSTDQKTYVPIDTIPAHGLTKGQYAARSADPAYGNNYYRLIQVNELGEQQVVASEILERELIEQIMFKAEVFRKGSKLPIQFVLKERTPVRLRIVDASGEVVKTESGYLEKGEQSRAVSLTGIPPGTYLAQVRTPGMEAKQKIRILQ